MNKNLEVTCQCDFMALTEIKGSGWDTKSQLHYTPALTSYNGTWWIHKGNMLFWRVHISINMKPQQCSNDILTETMDCLWLKTTTPLPLWMQLAHSISQFWCYTEAERKRQIIQVTKTRGIWYIYAYTHIHIQGVPGGMCQTSGGYSLC